MNRRERLQSLTRAPLVADRLLRRGRYEFEYDRMHLSVRGMSWRKRLNLLRAGLNLVWRRARPWAMPLHMQFELSSACNLRCPICPTGTGELGRPARFMDPRLFASVWDEVAPTLLTTSLWGWGESLLHPHLGDILRAARRHSVVTFVSTNGQNLDRDSVVEALVEHPPTYLIVALDGLTDETNSALRIGARLAPALAGVRRIAELKAQRKQRFPILHMRTIITRHNQHEVAQVRAFAARHGFEMLTLRGLAAVNTETSRDQFDNHIPDTADYRTYQYRDGQRVARQDHFCLHPVWFPSLFVDGTVVVCEQDFRAALPLGDAAGKTSFADIWFGEHARAVRRTTLAKDTPFCRDCPACDRGSQQTSFEATYFDPTLAPLILGEAPS